MYLRGNKWNMTRRTRRRSSPWRLAFLVILVGAALYVNQFVVPNVPGMVGPTPTPTTSPEAFVNEAESLFAQGKLVPAIQAYEQAILADPQNKANYVAMARAQIFAQQYEAALESAERALVGNDSYALAHAVRGWALTFVGDYFPAEASLKRALEIDPNNALAHAFYAELLTYRGEYGDSEKAIEESRLAISLGPDLLESKRARAIVLTQTGNFQEAIEMYKGAALVNKNIPDLYIGLGYNYKALDDYGQAIEYFSQANALNPSDAIPDLEISRIYAAVGDFGKSVQYAENAVRDDPENPHRYGNLGIRLYQAGEMEEAARILAYAIKGGTNEDGVVVKGLPLNYGFEAQYYWFYGFALAKSMPHKCDEAVPVFQALITGVPDDADAVYNANFGLDLCRDVVDGVISTPEDTPSP
jgi:tetratricopeptide (TPR) repeat protein